MSEHPKQGIHGLIEAVINARPRDLGGFEVGRALPSPRHKLVGPFIFFDHMGPANFAPGASINVRPHPHIGIATVTYLFDGEILHRDSVGSEQLIHPGDVNWMVAGRGIVHSERTRQEVLEQGQFLHGIQAWVALPLDKEHIEPAFYHHPKTSLPNIELPGVALRLIAGAAYGQEAGVAVASPTFYLDAQLQLAATLELPNEYAERAFYVVEGSVRCDGEDFAAREFAILKPGEAVLTANEPSRVMLLGGAPVGDRHIEWNFVSSKQEEIEEAKRAWRAREFPLVPGDELEFIPLP